MEVPILFLWAWGFFRQKVAIFPGAVKIAAATAETRAVHSGKEQNRLAWLPLQSLAVKKELFFVQILGGRKLLKFVEKCQ